MIEDRRTRALQFVRETFSAEVADQIERNIALEAGAKPFASAMTEMALDNVFAGLWLRPGLTRRERSLVTLSILIALRCTEELVVHTRAAITNGVSVAEIEELIYHATAYAGFPAANSATTVFREILTADGLIK